MGISNLILNLKPNFGFWENPTPTSTSVNPGFPIKIGVGSRQAMWVWVPLPCLFSEVLDLSLFDSLKDVKDGQLLDEDEIVVGEENDDEGDHEANV